MNKHNASPKSRRLLVAATTFAYICSALLPAHASDTEIYARSVTAGTLSPSLMFMLDTSGSMAWCLDKDNSSSGCLDGIRSTALKDAMADALGRGTNSIPGYVAVGLSTYDTSGDGGRVRYPVRPLDALVQLSQDGVLVSKVAYGVSDAEQLPGAGGLQDLVRDEISIGFKAGVQQSVGLHFDEILVPRGATIRSATLTFTANASDASAADPFWQFQVAALDNAPDFSTTSVNARTYTGTLLRRPGDWTAGDTYDFDVTDQVQLITDRGATVAATPPATGLVTNAGSWCGGNAISFRIQDITGAGTPARRAYSYEGALAAGNLTLAPRLEISYIMDDAYFIAPQRQSCTYLPFSTVTKFIDQRDDDGYWTASGGTVTTNTSSTPIAQVPTSPTQLRYAGLRFPGIAIARNAIIKEAAINVTANGNYTGIPAINVDIFNDDNTPTMSSGSSTKPSTAVINTFQWQPPGSAFVSNRRYVIPSQPQPAGAVTAQVQAVVNRSDWDSGDALFFRLSNSTTTNHNADIKTANANGSNTSYPSLYVRGYQPTPVTNLSTLTTVRSQLQSAVSGLTFTTNTPLGRAYLESARSMMAMDKSPSGTADAGTRDASNNYITTVTASDECAANYIFALTDGAPNSGNEPNDDSLDDTGDFGAGACTIPAGVTLGAGNPKTFNCMAGVARKLADGNGSIASKVKTNTVILGPLGGDAEDSMIGVAKAGRGKYYVAKTSGALVDAIQGTLDDLLKVSGTVSAPGVAVNQLSRLSHLDQLYFSVFNPRANDARWGGNVKRYKLNLVASRIDDSTDAAAIDDSTTFFKETAKSFWLVGTEPDGKNATDGGAANVLPAPDTRAGAGTARKMYSYYGTYPSTPASTSGQTLNQVVFGDSSLKTAMGLTDNTVFTNLTAWLLGYKVDDITDVTTYNTSSPLRYQMGGGLHSRPTLVNYGYSGTLEDAFLDADNQDNTVYFSDMEGVLHAVNAKTGKEVFSFIPKELLTRTQTLYANTDQALPEFGLDASWTVFRKDGNGDFKINSSSDKVIIYGGMRMGGSNYYALDVTDRASPKLLFALRSGSGAFTNMGQSWSDPVISSVKINGVGKTVLVFGGGYDMKHETEGYVGGTSDADTKGNQVYIVDAFTGELYWWASNTGTGRPTSGQVSDMKFAIPSTVKVLDSNDDGFADAFYVGDMGGQLFRLDVDNTNTNKDALIKRVKLFAKLGQTVVANTANQRRIYEPPSVARLRNPSTKVPYIAVAVGTGYRSHPLDIATTDMFYVMTDNDVLRADFLTPATSLQTTITGPGNTSVPATDELALLDLTSTAGVNLSGKRGWYIKLSKTGENGEKVLASPLIFGGEVYFTSYLPEAQVDSCSPVAGASRLYRMAARDGQVITDFNNSGGALTPEDRYDDSVILGIGAEPQIVIQANQKKADGSVVQKCPPLPTGKKAYCEGKEVSVNELACTTILVGTSAGKAEYQCRSGLKRTRWYDIK